MVTVLTTFIGLIKENGQQDVYTAEFEQIVNCVFHGEWDITPDATKIFFTVKNIKDIINAFNNHVE